MRILSIIFLSVLFISESLAQESRPGFSMLNNAPTPFSLALNEASTAIPQGSGAIYINPALLSSDIGSSLDFAYSSWIQETNFIFGGANFVKGNRAIAVGVYSSKIDGFEQRNNPGPSNGDFSISYLSLSGSLAYNFDFISVGIAGQYLNEDNYTFQASGYAFNFGLSAEFLDGRLKAGTSLLNIGEMEELNSQATELPEEFRFGMGFDLFRFSPPKNDDLPILVSITSDYVNPLSDYEPNQSESFNTDPFFNFGLLLDIAEVVQLSAGYKTGDTAKPLAFGAGFKTDIVNVNYALVPYETGFGTLHSFGLQYNF